MNSLYKVVAGIGTLIAVFLFLNNYKATTSIINTIGTNSIKGIQVLQGREEYIS